MINQGKNRRLAAVRITFACFLVSALSLPVIPAQDTGGVPVFKITPVKSTIKFAVKASVPIEGTFDKWDATLTFTSTAAESGVFDVKIQAASVNTGSGMTDGKLKGKYFFDAEHDPNITFKSAKIVQTGEISGPRLDFCILRCQFCPFYKGLQDFSRGCIQSGVFKNPFLPSRKS